MQQQKKKQKELKLETNLPSGTVDNLMDMRSKLEFYLQWVQDVAEHCDSLDVPIPQSAAAVRTHFSFLF